MRTLAILAALTLTACATQREPIVTARTEYVEVPVLVFRALPEERMQPHPIAEGPPSQCLDVAAQRRAEIVACNADKDSLRGLKSEPRPVE